MNVEKFQDNLRRAKARLSAIVVQETSLVPAAANLRRFVVVKSMDKKIRKLALALPSEAKTGIMEGLGQALDKLMAISEMVGEADVDEEAVVPGDLGAALEQCAQVISGLAQQYAPTAPANDPAATPPPEEVAASLEPTSGTAPEAPPIAKDLPPPEKDPLTMAPQRDPMTLAPKTMNLIGELSGALAGEFSKEIGEVAKAGRKISAARFKKLSELHRTLGGLMNELAFDEATGAGEESSSTKAQGTVQKAADDRLDQLLQMQRAHAAQLAAQNAKIEKMARAPDAPRSLPNDDGGGAPPAFKWPDNLNRAELRERKAAR